MTVILILFVAFCLPLFLILSTGQSQKRGCGRGCATCGNREICHGKKKQKRENAQKIEKNFDETEGC